MVGQTITVDLPPVPLTEVLLVLIAVLLWRCLNLLTEGVKLLQQISSAGGLEKAAEIQRPRALRAGSPAASHCEGNLFNRSSERKSKR